MIQLPPLTKALMLACIGVFCLTELVGSIVSWLALWPIRSGAFYPWQPLTYALVHGSFSHLFFNMLGLYFFGAELEKHLGRKRYAYLLIAGALSAATVQIGLALANGSTTPTVGLSGAIFALLLVMALEFGEEVIMPIIPPVPMKMKFWVVGYGVLELVMGYGPDTGIAHFAHLGGMVGGFGLMRYWRWQAARKLKGKSNVHKLH